MQETVQGYVRPFEDCQIVRSKQSNIGAFLKDSFGRTKGIFLIRKRLPRRLHKCTDPLFIQFLEPKKIHYFRTHYFRTHHVLDFCVIKWFIFELNFKSIMNRATDLKKQSSGNEKPKKVDEEERFKCFMEVEGEQKFAQYAFWCFPITAHFGNISLSFWCPF